MPQRGFTLFEVLLALSLSALLCVGIFHLYLTLSQLQSHQEAVSYIQQNNFFMETFLRQKIQAAGDWSCLQKSPGTLSFPVRGYSSDDANKKLGLTIKPETDLLQLHECVHLHNQKQYLPVEFFIANTYRTRADGSIIYALFYKVDHHPREELITNVTHFDLRFGVRDKKQRNIIDYKNTRENIAWKKVGAVEVCYSLSSLHPIFRKPHAYWFFQKMITPKNRLLHQAGVLYAAVRKT